MNSWKKRHSFVFLLFCFCYVLKPAIIRLRLYIYINAGQRTACEKKVKRVEKVPKQTIVCSRKTEPFKEPTRKRLGKITFSAALAESESSEPVFFLFYTIPSKQTNILPSRNGSQLDNSHTTHLSFSNIWINIVMGVIETGNKRQKTLVLGGQIGIKASIREEKMWVRIKKRFLIDA